MSKREKYRIVQNSGRLGPHWIAFRKEPGKAGWIYVGHGYCREMARDIVASDRRIRQQPNLKLVG